MKSTSVRELRNNYSKVLSWVAKGEEVEVTRRGKVVAKMVPPVGPKTKVDWAQSAALTRSAWANTLTVKESAAILTDNQGN
jgi:prevent-host-death family protein